MNYLKHAAGIVMSLALAACAQTQTQGRTQSPVARGSYLVNGIMSCNHCRMPKRT